MTTIPESSRTRKSIPCRTAMKGEADMEDKEGAMNPRLNSTRSFSALRRTRKQRLEKAEKCLWGSHVSKINEPRVCS